MFCLIQNIKCVILSLIRVVYTAVFPCFCFNHYDTSTSCTKPLLSFLALMLSIKAKEKRKIQDDAEKVIKDDPKVKKIIEEFGAKVIDSSVESRKSE